MKFTVGQLKKWIEEHNLPDDAIIFMQRVEDVYFEKNNWKTVKKEGYHYHQAKKWNEDVESGKYLDKKKYPLFKPEMNKKLPDEVLENSKEQYYECFSPVKYKDDDNLYLDAHY